jgi:hypothetical protein
MLLDGERIDFFLSGILPPLCQVPTALVYFLDPGIKHRPTWGHFYTFWVGKISNPSLILFAYMFMGALCFEALEMVDEENSDSEFVRCLDIFSRSDCRGYAVAPSTAPLTDAVRGSTLCAFDARAEQLAENGPSIQRDGPLGRV